MLLGDRRNEVDGQIKQAQVSVGTETHVVDHFPGHQHAESLLTVPKRGKKSFAIAEGEIVVRAGVVDFANVLNTGAPTLADGVESV